MDEGEKKAKSLCIFYFHVSPSFGRELVAGDESRLLGRIILEITPNGVSLLEST